MTRKPTREDLEKRIRVLEEEAIKGKQVEETLHESEKKYREIFENAVEGIYQTTPEGQYLSANPAFARILGYLSPAELMAATFDIGRQIYVDPSRLLEMERLLLEHGMVRDFEAQLIRKDKNTIWVVINANVIRDEEGNIRIYQGTMIDITEKKHLENQLLQAKKMDTIGTLAGGIAHDFNNLLATIYDDLVKSHATFFNS
jgi:PAS domain S-box-containing protein